jgi:putative ABC transport system permease protein
VSPGAGFSAVRRALRVITLHRGFAATAILTIAVGVGATVTTLVPAERLLLRGPERVVDAGSVKRLYLTATPPGRAAVTFQSVGYVLYDLLARDGNVGEVAAYGTTQAIVGRGTDAEPAMLGAGTASFFPLLGIRAATGRLFTPSEDRPGDPARVVVLDHDFWKVRFGGVRGVIGTSITINDSPFTVIGILPAGVTGATLSRVDFWIPVSAWQQPTPDWTTTWNAQWLAVIARLPRGMAVDVASAAATTTFRRAYSGGSRALASAELSFRPLAFDDGGAEPNEAGISRWLAGVGLLVLLIACANVAHLMMSRAIDRRREIGLRLTLGSSAWRLAALLAGEAMVLAAGGGLAGAGLSLVGVRAMREFFFPDIAWGGPMLPWRWLALVLLLTIGVGILVALAPILEARRIALAAVIRGAPREGGAGPSRLRDILLVAQTALAVPLLIGAGLFVRSLAAIHAVDLGIEADRVLVSEVRWPSARGELSDSARSLLRNAREAEYVEAARRLAVRPDVERASLAVGLPFGYQFGVAVHVPGSDSSARADGGQPSVSAVSAGYFETVGTRIVAGRGFDATDGAGTEPVVVVSETAAREFWPHATALDRCVVVGNPDAPCARVVGIAHDAHRSSIRESARPQVYLPYGQQQGFGGTVLLVRPRGAARRFIGAVRTTLTALMPDALYPSVGTLQEAIDLEVAPWRAGAGLFATFGVLALLVAGVGLYAALAFAVARRSREFAIRIALGAPAHAVVRAAVTRATAAVALGLAFGVAASLAAAPWLQPLLFETEARDPGVFGVVAGVLGVVVLLASVIPAARALRTDAAGLLQAE